MLFQVNWIFAIFDLNGGGLVTEVLAGLDVLVLEGF